jgi:hypothetical protein
VANTVVRLYEKSVEPDSGTTSVLLRSEGVTAIDGRVMLLMP